MKKGLLLGLIVWGITLQPMNILAETMTTNDQVDQSRRILEQKEASLQEKKVMLSFGVEKGIEVPHTVEAVENKTEGNVQFTLKVIKLEGDVMAFPFLIPMVEKFEHTTVDMKKINDIVHNLNNELLHRGYVTSQVTIPEQNIKSGILRLMVMAGKVEAVTINGKNSNVSWGHAFPVRTGDVLNIRTLEQGLEQMKSMKSSKSIIFCKI